MNKVIAYSFISNLFLATLTMAANFKEYSSESQEEIDKADYSYDPDLDDVEIKYEYSSIVKTKTSTKYRKRYKGGTKPPRKRNVPWSTADEELLLYLGDNRLEQPWRNIVKKHFPNRTIKALQAKYRALKLALENNNTGDRKDKTKPIKNIRKRPAIFIDINSENWDEGLFTAEKKKRTNQYRPKSVIEMEIKKISKKVSLGAEIQGFFTPIANQPSPNLTSTKISQKKP